MLNKAILMGRLVYSPELKYTQNGTAVLSFTVAVNRRRTAKDQEQKADFIDCVAWRSTAEFIGKYFVKGQMIVLAGQIQTRNWEDKQGNTRKRTEVLVDEVEFGETKKAREASGAGCESAQQWSQPQAGFEEIADDDGEVPF